MSPQNKNDINYIKSLINDYLISTIIVSVEREREREREFGWVCIMSEKLLFCKSDGLSETCLLVSLTSFRTQAIEAHL